jgi:mitochondrial fission process protein 1
LDLVQQLFLMDAPIIIEQDIWRDSPLRYSGYANEVGEAFRPLYPKFVRPSYAVASLYVLGDTADKFYKSQKNGDNLNKSLVTAGDALLWQTMASVIIPGQAIHILTSAATKLCATSALSSRPRTVRLYSPTVIGLTAIPFIIHPIDDFVTYTMDNTVRKI